MRKLMLFLFLFLIVTGLQAANVVVVTPPQAAVIQKPAKKQQVSPGNFEVILGTTLRAPIDTAIFRKAAIEAASTLGYRVSLGTVPNTLNLSIQSALYSLDMRICFWTDEYWYEYVGSDNLGADPSKNRILYKYNSWLKNLEKRILQNYLKMQPVQRIQATATKPVKKKQMAPGNFEVITSASIPRPINMERFNRAATTAALTMFQVLPSDNSSVIRLRLEKRNFFVEFNICFWNDGYWYEYVDSSNLDADPVNNKIHRNYFRWIEKLDKRIEKNYFKL